mmetsp:Transcript_71989/g.198656  ORF Transcript_71989/g.198656 Transcript_71989/m.198656 type:complete len:981 (+) Transcript_71989:100-3042(+)
MTTKDAVTLVYTGALDTLCDNLFASINERPGAVVVHIPCQTSWEPTFAEHFCAFRRLVRLFPCPVVCRNSATALSGLDVLVVLACDLLQAVCPRPRIVPPQGVVGAEALRAARRAWRFFARERPAEDFWDLTRLSLTAPKASAEIPEVLGGLPPQFWMALRNAGLASPIAVSPVPGPGGKPERLRDAFGFYMGPKTVSLFAVWDAQEAGAGAWPGVAHAARVEAAAAAVRCLPSSSPDVLALELTSDVLLVAPGQLLARCKQALLQHPGAWRVEVSLLDGKVATSGSIFPWGALNHSDVYKWHRKWEQCMGALHARRVVATARGTDLSPPLMELFFSANVRTWASPATRLAWCQPPAMYCPGPEAMQGLLGTLSVTQLRRLLMMGLEKEEASALGLTAPADGAAAPGQAAATAALGGEPPARVGRPVRSQSAGPLGRSCAEPQGSEPLPPAEAVVQRSWEWGAGLLRLPDFRNLVDTPCGPPMATRGSLSLLGYGLAVPGEEHRWRQTEVASMLGVPRGHPHHTLFEQGHIRTRYLAELERDLRDPAAVDLTRLREKHLHWAQVMLREAIQKACKDAGISPKEIGHVSVCSSSGYILPGLTAYVVKDSSLGIPANVSRMDIVGMGCHAGLNSLKSAGAWAVANRGKYALSCGVEVLSAQYVWGTESRQLLNTALCNSLFADGCFAAVLRSAPEGESPPPAYLDCPARWWAQACDTNALDDMVYYVERSEGKHYFHLSELAPYHVGQGLFDLMHVALTVGVPVHCVEHVVSHTGGRTVLDCVAPALGLEGGRCSTLPHSVAALRDFGNQSSPSFMFAFDKLAKSNTVNDGDLGLFVTMGPGAGLELAAWTAGARFPPREAGAVARGLPPSRQASGPCAESEPPQLPEKGPSKNTVGDESTAADTLLGQMTDEGDSSPATVKASPRKSKGTAAGKCFAGDGVSGAPTEESGSLCMLVEELPEEPEEAEGVRAQQSAPEVRNR